MTAKNGGNAKFNMSGVVQTCGNGHGFISRPQAQTDEAMLSYFESYFREQVKLAL